jgi:hypothetical protein
MELINLLQVYVALADHSMKKKNRRRIEKCLERKGMRFEGKNLEKIIKLRRNLEFLDSPILNIRKIE